MSSGLEGKRVLLTGASRGVGFAAAKALLGAGAEVIGLSKNAEGMGRASEELSSSGRFHGLTVTLGGAGYLGQIAAEVERVWGALDILIHNAGVMLHREDELCQEPDGILEDTFATNVMVPFHLTRALLPFLERGTEPRILNVGSGAGTLEGMKEPGIAAYRLSKWTAHGLTMLQAKELAGKVSVNAFDPGWIKTDLGGPHAPGTPEQAAAGLIATLKRPWGEHGRFFKDGQEISW